MLDGLRKAVYNSPVGAVGSGIYNTIAGATGMSKLTNTKPTTSTTRQLNYGGQRYDIVGTQADVDKAKGYLDYQNRMMGISSGGGITDSTSRQTGAVVNSTPVYDAAAAQRAADYSAANEDVNYAEGRIDPNFQIGYDNLLGQYNSGIAKLTGDKERATRDYKTATTRAQDGRADTVSRINQGISNQFSGVKRLLGSRGAGSSSAAQIAAPYAVGALGNEQRQGVQRTYGLNMQDIDTKRGDYLQDWEVKRGETETWKNNQTKALEAKRAEQRVKIAQQRAALNPGNAAQYRSSIRDLMTQIDNLGRTDSYVAPTAAYKAPELTAYGYQPAGGPAEGGDTSAAQKLGAYYTLLPEEQKEELL